MYSHTGAFSELPIIYFQGKWWYNEEGVIFGMASITGVRGDLLQWARGQQGLTMRLIYQQGGPSPGYQSEVENGKKVEVLSDMLTRWIKILGVTEAFARGIIPKYRSNPSGCLGLAADIGVLVTIRGSGSWKHQNAEERVREVFRMIVRESKELPRVVLAWVLDLQVATLDDLIEGSHPIMRVHAHAASRLTGLPEALLVNGAVDSNSHLLEEYIPAIQMAASGGITPDELMEFMKCLSKIVKNKSGPASSDERRAEGAIFSPGTFALNEKVSWR